MVVCLNKQHNRWYKLKAGNVILMPLSSDSRGGALMPYLLKLNAADHESAVSSSYVLYPQAESPELLTCHNSEYNSEIKCT